MESTPETQTKNGVLHLFCDANLFLQCHPLEDLDWKKWQHYQSVHLIVCGPVLREIDALKNKGNNRQSKRARRASTTFRSLRPSGFGIIKESNPTVTVHIETHHRMSAQLADDLDYNERDDQLIGTIYEYAQSHTDVRLLTDDTTPLYIAEGVALRVELIPDSWRLPPEFDTKDKQISALKTQVNQLTKSKPVFSVRFQNQLEQDVDRYEPDVDSFSTLSPSQIDRLMLRLEQCHPIATDFGRRDQKPLDPIAFKYFAPPDTKFYVPPTDDEIDDYTENAYPNWLVHCQKFISQYHQVLQEQQPPLGFTFLIENQGKYPAKDCLVTNEARGNLLILPAPTNGDVRTTTRNPSFAHHCRLRRRNRKAIGGRIHLFER